MAFTRKEVKKLKRFVFLKRKRKGDKDKNKEIIGGQEVV